MPNTELRTLLAARRDELVKKAVESGGKVDETEWRELDRLMQLCAIPGPPLPQKSIHKRAVALFLCTMILTTLLLFTPIAKTEIAVEAATTALTFHTTKPIILMRGWNVRSLGLSGLRKVTLPAIQSDDAQTLVSPAPLRLEATSGSITLQPMALPADTTVCLAANGDGNYRLTIRLPAEKPEQSAAWTLTVNGHVAYAIAGSPPATMAFAAPRQLGIEPGEDATNLDLDFGLDSTRALTGLIPIDELSLDDTERTGATPGSPLQLFSTIRTGAIHYEEIDGAERKLSENEPIVFEELDGVLLSVHLHRSEVALRYAGRVGELATGTSARRKNLMPHWLEFLRAQRPVALLWGTSLYLFGILLTMLRWWLSDG